MKEKILVSACLIGEKCRYDGSGEYHQSTLDYCKDKEVVMVCPEVLGGMSTPRDPSERQGDKVFNCNGEDVSEYFLRGTDIVCDVVKKQNIKTAIMKSKSPSCGCGMIYDGSFSRKLIQGDGLCTQQLKLLGIDVIASDQLKTDEK